jgi:hypothetical protein
LDSIDAWKPFANFADNIKVTEIFAANDQYLMMPWKSLKINWFKVFCDIKK